jgi:hypothetical protein
MNRASRFRPRLEALEERSLLTVSVIFRDGFLAIDARQSTVSNTISISNNGAGHITAAVSGDTVTVDGSPGGGLDFSAVTGVSIFGGPGGAGVSYLQQGDALNPSGNQVYAQGFGFTTYFEGGTNTLVANLQGHALSVGPVIFLVEGGAGHDTININARGVDIGPLTDFLVETSRNFENGGAGGLLNFNTDYSGTNRGRLAVNPLSLPGAYAVEDLRVDATFLGTLSNSRTTPFLLRPHGASPGDLSLYGGPGDNSMVMELFSPGGLPVTGDVFGGPGENSCLRTANVKAHNCQQDRVVGVRPIANLPRLPVFNPALFLHP